MLWHAETCARVGSCCADVTCCAACSCLPPSSHPTSLSFPGVGLEKDIAGLKREIRERDETIGDKERRIYELKKKNQELEKFKFVLDYKIKELKKQVCLSACGAVCVSVTATTLPAYGRPCVCM